LLKQWRKETFGDPSGIQMPADWKPTGETTKKPGEAVAGKADIREGGDGDGERKKKRRKKSKNSKA